MSVYLLDQPLSPFIAGMRLARKHDLQWVILRDGLEALQIAEDEVGALVRRHAPGKTQQWQARVQR